MVRLRPSFRQEASGLPPRVFRTCTNRTVTPHRSGRGLHPLVRLRPSFQWGASGLPPPVFRSCTNRTITSAWQGRELRPLAPPFHCGTLEWILAFPLVLEPNNYLSQTEGQRSERASGTLPSFPQSGMVAKQGPDIVRPSALTGSRSAFLARLAPADRCTQAEWAGQLSELRSSFW